MSCGQRSPRPWRIRDAAAAGDGQKMPRPFEHGVRRSKRRAVHPGMNGRHDRHIDMTAARRLDGRGSAALGAGQAAVAVQPERAGRQMRGGLPRRQDGAVRHDQTAHRPLSSAAARTGTRATPAASGARPGAGRRPAPSPIFSSQARRPRGSTLFGPAQGGTVGTQGFIPHRCHASIGVFGAAGVAAGCTLSGSPPADLAVLPPHGRVLTHRRRRGADRTADPGYRHRRGPPAHRVQADGRRLSVDARRIPVRRHGATQSA